MDLKEDLKEFECAFEEDEVLEIWMKQEFCIMIIFY